MPRRIGVVTCHPPRRTRNRFGFDESNPYGIARTETPRRVDCMDASHPRHRRYAHHRRALWQHQAHYVL